MAKDAGPKASTLATSTDNACFWTALFKATTISSTVVAEVTDSTPDAWATCTRSVPVEVAVGNPPTESKLSLSNIRWTRLIPS